MKRLLLALTLSLGVASVASADFVIIVANLGQGGAAKFTLQTVAPGLPGARPPVPGQPPGAPTFPTPGAPGAPVAPGAPGAPANAKAPASEDELDPDTVPLMVVAVVEVEKKLGLQDFVVLARGGAVRAKCKIGGQICSLYLANTPISMVAAIHPENKAMMPLQSVYEDKIKALKDTKAQVSAQQMVELAEWAFAHGMLERFKKHMDQAVELDKAHPKVAGYLQMKATLAKPVENADTAGPWRQKFLTTRYQTTKSAHYALLQNDTGAAEVRVKALEEALENYYYWFALRGVQLPVPRQRLVAVLTADEREFKHLRTTLDATPLVSNAFYAPREAIAVFSARRIDEAFDRLEKFAAPLWSEGYNRDLLLKGKGYPPGAERTRKQEVYEAMTLALLLKAMEIDGEVAGATHGVSRQLLYASGFLPRSVDAPEWVQFGASSFFETAQGSPWRTVGAPSFRYLPVYLAFSKAKKFPTDRVEFLKRVVTDYYFRNPDSGSSPDVRLRKARCTAWSLAYFLLRKRLDGLQRYFKELNQMPRDLELDEESLWLAFARAFNAVDAAGQPDQNALQELADDWDKDMQLDQVEDREGLLMREMWQTFKEAVTRINRPAPTPANGPPVLPGPGGRPGINRAPGQ